MKKGNEFEMPRAKIPKTPYLFQQRMMKKAMDGRFNKFIDMIM